MKIVIFGLTVSSSWGNGHATLWRGLCRALAQRGHCIVFFERDVPYYAAARDLTILGGCWFHLYPDWNEVLPLARRQVADADVALITSYCPDAIAATDLVLDSPARVRVFYDMDTPITLERLLAGEPVAYVPPQGLAGFDLVLSYSGGVALAHLAELLHASRVAPLYGSVDPEQHHRAPALDWLRADLSWLGTWSADRQTTLAELFLEPAARLPDRRFLIGGAQYPADFPWRENVHFVRHLPPALHPHFFGSSRITLNVTRRAMAAMGHCPSGRLFEAAACGTPILTDRWPGLEEFFEPGAEVLTAANAEEAAQALQLSDRELQQVAAAARERVLRDHTAERRAMQFETLAQRVAAREA